jgi:hypothetical protein
MKGNKTKNPNAFSGFDIPTSQNIQHMNSTNIHTQIEQAVVLRSLVLSLGSIPERRGISVISSSHSKLESGGRIIGNRGRRGEFRN